MSDDQDALKFRAFYVKKQGNDAYTFHEKERFIPYSAQKKVGQERQIDFSASPCSPHCRFIATDARFLFKIIVPDWTTIKPSGNKKEKAAIPGRPLKDACKFISYIVDLCNCCFR